MRLLILVLVCACPAWADTTLTDAFGVADPQDFERAAWAGWRETFQGRGERVAPGPGARVQLHLGDKSLVAGRDRGLALAIVTDAAGNLVADGAGVTLRVAGAQDQVPTRGGIAAMTFGPLTQAGQFDAGAAIAGQQSARHDFVVTAATGDVQPVLHPLEGAAQPETFAEIEVRALPDHWGNPVADGSGVTVLVAGADGSTSVLPGVFEDGVARARLLARDVAARGVMRAALGAEMSGPQALTVAALRPAAELPIKARPMDEIAATALVLGPFLTDAGHVLNDGARVEVQVTTRHGALPAQRAWVLDGEVRFTVLIGPQDFPITVNVTSSLGRVQRVIKRQGLVP